jgi:hypothetical protein
MTGDFKNEMFSSHEPNPVPRCDCGAEPILKLKFLDPSTGQTVRMFKCECGRETWNEAKD